MRIAVIVPLGRLDYMTGTILDGLIQLEKEDPELEFRINETSSDWRNFSVKSLILDDKQFVSFARSADLVFFIDGKDGTDYKLADLIGRWDKTVFIDGSEPGKNGRFDFELQSLYLNKKTKAYGAINREMLSKCALYCRREKPYIDGILPLPFGIESKYTEHYNEDVKKDIDFVCIFGQDEYPLLRRYSQAVLIDYCQAQGFTAVTAKTKNSDEFYNLLSRAKVGISVGGGGYDTARFWEILGNNCILFTEKIDVFQLDSEILKFDRIIEFSNLFDFKYELEKLGKYLKNGYNDKEMLIEYQKVLSLHSGSARIRSILDEAGRRIISDDRGKSS